MTRSPARGAKRRPTAAAGRKKVAVELRPFASPIVPPWARPALRRPGGQPYVLALGWLLLLAAAGSLVWILTPPVSATIGSSGLTYNIGATASSAPGWLTAVLVLGSMLGFNLVYWFASPTARTRQLRWVLALYGVELLGVTGCVVWVTGAEYPAGAALSLTATNADGAIGITALIGVCMIACGIMLWLTTSTNFEQQRDHYLHDGRTTVTTTKVSIRSHIWWVVGLLAVWALIFVPMIASHVRTGDGYQAISGATTNLPWPQEYTYGDTFDQVLSVYSVLLALLWSTSLSLLVEKVLYRGPWAARAKASRRSQASRFARLVVKFRHWPFVLGATLGSLACFTPVNPDDSLLPTVLSGLVVAAAGFAVGMLFFRWEWKVRDINSNTVRLHLAGSG